MQTARILRVGGSDAEFETLAALLRGAGYTDVKHASASDAIGPISNREVDLVLLDLILSSNDVFSVLKAAQPQNGKTSRIPVLVTAPANANDRVHACLQRGAEDHLITPFDAENALVVTRRVELCLHRKHLREFTVRLRSEKSDINETAVIELYSAASGKFVPKEFLQHLGRQAITDVRLGDHVAIDMTVFFSDIRDFTTLSEGMTPKDNFEFLNSYLKRATPIIRTNHGFIDKYIGDAIMALFPNDPGDALKAATELQRELVTYNKGRRTAGYDPIRIGIGLHRGELILGTIGEEDRMQTTVIADAVNVASRIEGLTKTFGVGLLVSSKVVEKLPPGHQFNLRHLGAVKAKGKTKSVEIYECYDNDPSELKDHKTRTKELFSNGVSDFRKGLFLSAGKTFQRVAALNQFDTVAAHFRDSCTMSVMNRTSEWDGAEKIEVK